MSRRRLWSENPNDFKIFLFYRFVELLHSKQISSFLVTNAQFPDAMKAMKPCTQLYVSIDASTKETLKKVDRPLHKDFWERFILSLEELGKKTQRTVYRLTLVKVIYCSAIGPDLSDHLPFIQIQKMSF